MFDCKLDMTSHIARPKSKDQSHIARWRNIKSSNKDTDITK